MWKKSFSDREKLLKLEAKGWEFTKFATIYSNSKRSEQNAFLTWNKLKGFSNLIQSIIIGKKTDTVQLQLEKTNLKLEKIVSTHL